MKTMIFFISVCLLGTCFKAQAQNFITASKPDKNMVERIQKLAETYYPWVVEIRRHLHMHPELSGQEKKTMEYIASKLDSLGISYKTKVGGLYAVVAEIPGKNPKKRRIVLRADTDALPIFEINDVPYKSKNKGVSHKCGHDSHSGNLLGTARILNDLRDEFEGTIVLIWQPHEEKLPGGAPALIEAGVLDGADACIGLHVDPNLDAGTIGVRAGEFMASIDELEVAILGKGAHGGSGVHLSVDPILAAAHLLVGLEQIKSHNCPATTPMALSFGKIRAGEAPNVIPDTCFLNGTFRTLSDEWRPMAQRRMLEIAEGVSKSTGAAIQFHIKKGHPVLVNDPKITTLVENAAIRVLGKNKVLQLNVWLASEDFAHYSKVVPSCFFRLGVRNEARGITAGLHTNNFDIDESALKTGMEVMSWIALQALGTN
ncbi:MAG: M20 family metallopeptidase [Saprospiraceae bacterium]